MTSGINSPATESLWKLTSPRSQNSAGILFWSRIKQCSSETAEPLDVVKACHGLDRLSELGFGPNYLELLRREAVVDYVGYNRSHVTSYRGRALIAMGCLPHSAIGPSFLFASRCITPCQEGGGSLRPSGIPKPGGWDIERAIVQ